jgi:NADPH-dependent glutamate synthase beta subunit-like oxidoreductase
VTFRPSVNVGVDVTGEQLRKEFDAVVLAVGATKPRDLPVPGRELDGVHYAMEFLPQQNKRVAGDDVPNQLTAAGKHVIVIGGGDTGSDCIGTSNRQRARSITQFEILARLLTHQHSNKAQTTLLAPALKITSQRDAHTHTRPCSSRRAQPKNHHPPPNSRAFRACTARSNDEGG